MNLATQKNTVAHDQAAIEPLWFGMEIRTCGGCGGSYPTDEGHCPDCGPRRARTRRERYGTGPDGRGPIDGSTFEPVGLPSPVIGYLA
ncbi:MAG: hypothetical protein ACR2K6_02910 [Solirubrobacterales bacterium]